MPLPDSLRKAGQIFDSAKIPSNVRNVQLKHNYNPDPNPYETVEALGRNAGILTGNPLFGGLGVEMNPDFRADLDARQRLNDLRLFGAVK